MTLPKGWVETNLQQACVLLTDGTHFSPSNTVQGDFPYITAKNIKWAGIDARKLTYVSRAEHEIIYRRCPTQPGDVLLIKDGATTGVATINDFDGEFSMLSSVALLRPAERLLNNRYLWYWLRSDFAQAAIAEAMNGSAIRRLTLTTIGQLKLAICPLAEQRRIVAKLDTLTARLTRARTELDRVAAMAKALRRGVSSYAFDAALSSVSLDACPVSDYCLSVTDGDHQAPPKSADGIPFITISAMNTGTIDLQKASRFVPQSYFDSLKPSRQPQPGDVLYSVTGSFGIPAVVESNDRFVFQRHIAILRPKPEACLPQWLWFMLAAPQSFKQASEIATGTAQMTVPLTGLRNLKLPKIGLKEQAQQTRMLQTAFARADRLEAEAARARALLDRLEAAVLARAFRGELVPQDPTDEPASVLLDRIRAERAAAPKTKRGRRAKELA